MDALQRSAPSFDFFHAVFLCEMIYACHHPDQTRDKLEHTGFHFTPYEGAVYPAADIRAFSHANGVMSFVLNFMGLYGIDSPIPRCYLDELVKRSALHEDNPLKGFFDLFNTRLYWLYYLSWRKYRSFLDLQKGLDNKNIQRAFSFLGFAITSDRDEKSLSPFFLWRFSGLLNNRVRSKAGLRLLLQGFFPDFSIAIDEFVRCMVQVETPFRVGKAQAGCSLQLGRQSIIGRCVPDVMSRIRIHLGPMMYSEYEKFLFFGRYMRSLIDLLKLYCNDDLEYDLNIKVDASTVPRFRLGRRLCRFGNAAIIGRPQAKIQEYYFRYELLCTIMKETKYERPGTENSAAKTE